MDLSWDQISHREQIFRKQTAPVFAPLLCAHSLLCVSVTIVWHSLWPKA